jgi:branched-chain amino acid aminotransferase
MSIQKTEKIWHNGNWIPWDEAKIHVLSHGLSFGSGVFEGIRCYETPSGPAIFRLREHIQRLVNSCKIYRTELDLTVDELCAATTQLPAANKLNACYIKPLVVRGYGDVGLNPFAYPVEIFISCWAWGAYLGAESFEKGVDACVSSWTRLAPNTLPTMAKVAANYMNSQLIRMEAVTNGYAEGIALDASGSVSEGSGMNLFLVSEGLVITPPLSSNILPGVTRRSVMTLCRDLNIPIREQSIPREMLYIADELFFAGTATEIVPVRSVDRIPVGSHGAWPITRALQAEFFALTRGKKPDRHNWLTPIDSSSPAWSSERAPGVAG